MTPPGPLSNRVKPGFSSVTSSVRMLPGNLTFKLLANYYQELFPVTFLLASEQTNCLPGKASEQLPGIFRPVLAQDYQSW
ncbi:hypothetical protein V9T40_012493 [Parthenolecanium corni]|uniref:Uncharacterized protein n=1 Tax=Parthenolecanium corni TaxID=536013 RepID=A0AAN9TKI4_9HEMI